MQKEITIQADGKNKRDVANRIVEALDGTHFDDAYFKSRSKDVAAVLDYNGHEEIEVENHYDGTFTIRFIEASGPTVQAVKNLFGVESGVQDTRSGSHMRDRNQTRSSSAGPNELKSVNSDGSIEFMPPYSKQDAEYIPEGSPQGGPDCKDCAHYIEGGGCHIVQGEIDPNGHCESFYADVGVYGREHSDGEVELNLTIWGEAYRWGMEAINKFAEKVKDKLREGK